MSMVSNGNIFVMKWHKAEREREQNLAEQFTLHSAEAYSELFPTSKQGGYLIGGDCFQKNIHLRCLKRF